MEFTIAKQKDVNGSGRKGTLHTTGAYLLRRFGTPHNQIPDTEDSDGWLLKTSDGKVRFEWAFKAIDNSAVITIYDYKDDRPFKEIFEWHVGAKGNREKIQKFFDTYFPDGGFEWDN